MSRVILWVVLVLAVGGVSTAWGATPYRSDAELQAEVKQGMEDILDLWRDGRYDALYDRTTSSGRQTREKFVKTLAAAPLRPACCWEKIQEVKVALDGVSRAKVHARLGLEGGGGTEYKTRSFKLVKEEGVWLMNRSDIVSLAEGGTKKKHRKKSYSYKQ